MLKPLFERLVIYSLLFLSSGAIIGVYVGRQTAGGGAAVQLVFAALYACLLILILPWHRDARSLLFQEAWMLAFVALAAVSTLWSIEPGDTLRRSVALFGTILAGLYIGMRYEPKEQVRMVAACVAIGAIASLAVCLFFPKIGLAHDKAWQGVYFPKNSLARMMALGVLCFTWLSFHRRRGRVFAFFIVPLCLVLMVLAKSATGIVVCILLPLIAPLRGVFAWPTRRLVALLIIGALIAVPVGVWSIRHSEIFLDALARSSSLTGRMPLWHTIKLEIMSRPVLGFGFDAFWSSAAADQDRLLVHWDAPNAHNGFLEIALGLGVVGLAIFLMGLARNFWLAIQAAGGRGGPRTTWPIFFLSFFVLYNLTESTLFVPNSLISILYIANACWLVRTYRQPVLVPENEPPLGEMAAEGHMGLNPAEG